MNVSELSDFFFRLLTFPSSAYVIVPVFLWGLIGHQRRVFILSLLLFWMSTRINMHLKEFFQVPLNPELGLTHTYAFPSGHIQHICVLWGSLANFYQSRLLNRVVLAMIIANSIAIYVLKFHSLLDILGGYYVALIILLGASILIPRRKNVPSDDTWNNLWCSLFGKG